MSGPNHTVACPKCKHQQSLRGKAMVLAATCQACGEYFRLGRWTKTMTRFESTFEPALPIGAKGRIDGTVYEVMGFVVKQETKYRYKWREYLVFNPFKGYAFLSEYDGHWNFIWPVKEDHPRASDPVDFHYQQRHFRLYQKYRADVVYARGEFFFDVVDLSSSTFNKEYIAPPYMLALEQSDDSLLWCKGEYITPAEVATAFGINVSALPSKTGVGYTQPLQTAFRDESLIKFSVLLLFLMIAVQLFFSNWSEEREVYRGNFSEANLGDQKFFKTPSFTLSGGSKSLVIDLYSPVDNDWFFAEISLIDEATGDEHIFTKDVAFYHGYEDGTSWSEGSSHAEAFLSRIPGGTYHINIYPEFSTTTHQFSMVVKRDVPTASNFFIAVLVLAIFPILYFIRKHMMEMRRWRDSDYSPYASE